MIRTYTVLEGGWKQKVQNKNWKLKLFLTTQSEKHRVHSCWSEMTEGNLGGPGEPSPVVATPLWLCRRLSVAPPLVNGVMNQDVEARRDALEAPGPLCIYPSFNLTTVVLPHFHLPKSSTGPSSDQP